MRPHRLRVTAFGAFGGTVEVGFDELASSGLFLLHGETGAGKTTLLDAVGFALYGRVPGERGKARRLRSDHAAPGTSTEVQLEATLGGRRMRITRKPEQERAKLRGAGTTTEQARVLLEEQAGGSWRAVSTRVGEADAEIADLMGMSADQFFQVVLLPQGEFARFLHADAGDRAKLLQRLFGTDRFHAVEEWLARRRKATADEVRDAEAGISGLLARVAQAAGVPVPSDDPEPSDDPLPSDDPQPPAGWAAQLAEVAATAAAAGQAQVAGHRQELDQALDLQRDAERLAERQRRRQDALDTRDRLAAAQADLQDRRAELAAAARAAEVAPALAEADRTSRALAQARVREDQARQRAAAGPGVTAPPGASAAELRAAGQEHVTRLGRLEALRSVSRQADDEDQAAEAARASAAALAAQVDAATAELANWQQQRPGLSRERDQAAEAGQRLPAVQAEADRYGRAADDARALVKALADKSRQERAWSTAKLEAAELIMRAARLREDRIDGMRAELAATLVNGAPCPVCGSLDHPELCELQGERVTREQEEAADAEAAAATERAESTGTRLGAADERVNVLSARLREAGFGEAADLPQAEVRKLESTARDLAGRVGNLAATAARHAELQAALEALDQAIADTGKQLAELTEQRESGLRQAAGADLRAGRHRESLLAQLGGQPDLDTALTAARQAADALTAAADAADATMRAEDDTRRAGALAVQAAAEAGFADLEPLADRAAEARRLADLAAGLGANTLRMTLSSFVLAARLEEVAAAASERLLKMTSGRYSLVHTDARRGAGRSGLGLLACDGWTGVDRDTSTLSGGETFLASLALALGLADVVTAEAGGTRIEALFVDEGFGSLDEDTLEEVMTVLDGLREGGRTVGIVSHVAELRQRIPAQVRVHKGQAGSHLTLRTQVS